ncbi:MAG TPA: type III pantothenate kinase [Pyrinomonadaceae bacterium]|nr:type III pantothenate kinase [Pyrinomonadaceae bacterium]
MLLAIDVGNSNTSLGVFQREQLVAHWRLTTDRSRTVDEYGVHARNLFELAKVDFKSIDAIAIASVVPPLDYTLKAMAETYFHVTPLFVDSSSNTGLTILYEPASDVGADRIVDAVAAIEKYGAPCIVVDFGTATTFDVIDDQARYVGGVICPGIMISSDALFARAAKLPRVDIRRPRQVIGSSTTAAMQSGLYYGYTGLVDGILRRIIAELNGVPTVISTGGLAALIKGDSEYISIVDDTLTLEGLRLVYDRNKA